MLDLFSLGMLGRFYVRDQRAIGMASSLQARLHTREHRSIDQHIVADNRHGSGEQLIMERDGGLFFREFLRKRTSTLTFTAIRLQDYEAA